MKLKLLSLIALMAIVMSCSKDDDDPAPSVDNAKFSFAGNEEIIAVPAAMQQSSDPYASQVASMAMEANFTAAYFTMMMVPPEGAVKSTTEIVASNGRTAQTNSGNVVVYTYSYGDAGQTLEIAYQIKDQSDSFLFEIFMNTDGSWYKLLSASEKKDKSSGYMHMYSELDSEPIYRWEWTRSGDTINFLMTDFEYTKSEMTINNKTKAGSVKSYWATGDTNITWELSSEITWNADGSGTWKEYTDGEVSSQGEFQP